METEIAVPPKAMQRAYDVVVAHYLYHQQVNPPGHRPTLGELMRTTDLCRTTCRVHRRRYERTLRAVGGDVPRGTA